MAKITIRLSEGPQHNEEIEINGPVKSDDHFVHEGYTYRVINNGEYAQCCGRVQEVTEQSAPINEVPKAPTKSKARKAPAKKAAPKKAKAPAKRKAG